MELIGNIQNKESISGAILNAGDISGALSNPLARGPSAYEIAVSNGFQGSEKEWLESLHGYTPIRGIDYWTKEDIDSIKRDLKNYIDQLLTQGEE